MKYNNWVAVKDRLPECNSNCLITTDRGEIFTSEFYGYGEECQGFKEFPQGVWDINEFGIDIIAWQLLPEPYKELEI